MMTRYKFDMLTRAQMNANSSQSLYHSDDGPGKRIPPSLMSLSSDTCHRWLQWNTTVCFKHWHPFVAQGDSLAVWMGLGFVVKGRRYRCPSLSPPVPLTSAAPIQCIRMRSSHREGFSLIPRSLSLMIDRLNGRRTLRRLDTEDTFMVPTLPTLLAARRPSQTVTRALCSRLP